MKFKTKRNTTECVYNDRGNDVMYLVFFLRSIP